MDLEITVSVRNPTLKKINTMHILSDVKIPAMNLYLFLYRDS